MLDISLNTFYKGLAQDDIVSSSWGLLDSKNIDGNRTGYGVTLGPKMLKKRLVGNTPVCIGSGLIGCNNGEIYELSGLDTDAAYYTFASGDTIVKILSWAGNYIIFTKPSNVTYTNLYVYKIGVADWGNKVFTSLDTVWISTNGLYGATTLLTKSYLYIGGLDKLSQVDGGLVVADKAYFNGYVNHISLQGTTLKVFTEIKGKGTVAYWDKVSTGLQSEQITGFGPLKGATNTTTDYILGADGTFNIGNGYQMEEVNIGKTSARLNDNSLLKNIFNITPNYHENRTIENIGNNILVKAVDTTACIYKYSNLIRGIQKSFHKIINQNHLAEDLTGVTDIYNDVENSIVYFCNTSALTNSVDYIDSTSKTTSKDGYIITQVFRGPPDSVNQMKGIKLTTSYTSGNNFIKIYRRIDNGSWILIKTINDTTDIIQRHKFTSDDLGVNISNRFIDIQFKIEFHNDLQTDFPPILHGMKILYDIIEE